jgi:pseudouridine synthase
MDFPIRLNKYLAACGVDSRRGCDAMIFEGRVEINGHPCLQPGTQVKDGDHVRIDGKRVTLRRSTTILLNKPRGLVCSKDDELGRETIYTLLPGALQHLHHVGRLDADSEGLLLLTNDGDLTQRLMHPRNKVEKEYLVTSNQPYEQQHLDLFLSGVYSKEGKLHAKSLRRMSARRISMVLDQGAKRQIRVMHEALGYQVLKLVRVRIGTLWGGDLEVGRYALLSSEEIEKACTNPETAAPKSIVHKEGKPRPAKKSATKGAKPAAKKPARKSAFKRRFDDVPPPSTGRRGAVKRPRKY